MKRVESMAELLVIIIVKKTSKSLWFSKLIVELPPHIWIEITVKFSINHKKPTFGRFFMRVYKIRVVTVFLVQIILVLKYLSLEMIWGQFLSKKYQFDKNNSYVQNIAWLSSLSSKLESNFFIISVFDKMWYKCENEAILKILGKLIITATNLLIYYLILVVSYKRLLLINKLMFIGIEFEIPRKTSCIYHNSTKPRRNIRLY